MNSPFKPLLLCLILVLFLFGACADDDGGTTDPTGDNQPNILLIIADDMGKDATPGFSEGSVKPNTPNLDGIRNSGLSFNNLWVNPTCSPTRASMITGKYGHRTGVKWAGDELDQSEVILHRYLKEETNDTYSTAVIGKWHLSGENATLNPEVYGMDYYAGLTRGAAQSYYQWQLNESGAVSFQSEYTTQVFTDLSIDWIKDQTQPWFLWLAYNAPHTPFHIPPAEMHTQGDLPAYVDGMDATPYYMAAIEAMDYQIGRLLEEMPEEELDNTIIIFLGDNGTPPQVVQAPYTNTSAKGSMYQGGVNVPLFVSGKGVERTGQDNSLLCSTDVFSTIAELAGINGSEIHDSKSFASLLTGGGSNRTYQYSELKNDTNDLWAISNGTYKLIVNATSEQEMYHLGNDPYERTNLLSGTLTAAEEAAKTELEAELLNIRN